MTNNDDKDMVSFPKLSISNVQYDKSAYWKGHYDSVVQTLRETINSQAEIIAELETVRVNTIKQLEDLRETLDSLKQSIGLDDSVPAKYITDVVKKSAPVVAAGDGWAMSSSGDIRQIDSDEVALQRAIRKADDPDA